MKSPFYIKQANLWRDTFNPLRGLTMARAVCLLEEGQRGQFADLQWLYSFVERRYPVLRALKRRRSSALSKLNWTIKTVPKEMLPPGATSEQAEEQKTFLRSIYDGIDNTKAAIQFLSSAEFRGYAHLEKHFSNDGDIVHLEAVPQWYWVRQGLGGDWEYNAKATNTTRGVPIEAENFIIREVCDPINEIALIAFLRANLGEKDWDGYIESYGIPPLFIIGPPNVPRDKETEYQRVAEEVASDARGYLPNGSDIKSPPASDRQNNPFRDRLEYLEKEVVLAGTGGLLSMLNEPTGIGGGQSETHDDAFDDLAEEEANDISGLFQRNIDAPALNDEFPDQPVLAYFEIAAQEETEVSEICDDAQKLSSAGYQIAVQQLSEKTGYDLELKGPPVQGGAPGFDQNPNDPQIANRDTNPIANSQSPIAKEDVLKAIATDMQPVRKRLENILKIEDPEILGNRLAAFRAELPSLLKDINADPASASAMRALLEQEFVAGLTTVRGNTVRGNS